MTLPTETPLPLGAPLVLLRYHKWVVGMFRAGCALASKFTFPVIICQRTISGKCAAGIGAYVLVNKEGWIATAGHVLKQFVEGIQSVERCRNHGSTEAAIRADVTIDEKERRKRLRALGYPKPDDVSQCAIHWSGSPTTITVSNVSILDGVDLGIGKLEGFVPASGQIYPVFKDPSRDFDPGASLCKLGYPFHSISPTFDQVQQRFELPTDALPVPQFPIEGIFTRIAKVVVPNAPDPGFPLLWVETSSPGLRGQSGGPTFDTKGTVWAIQCQTSHYDLGFNSKTPQFYNVGLGVHTETLFNVFDRNAVKYEMSDY
jgi:hypothetical protein